MIYSITNDQPFQVLSTNFSISPSESGYNLQISANGIDYTDFATVGAGVTRQFTGMANGNFYRLSGNTGTVEVNWMRECSPAGGGGGGGYVLPTATASRLGGVKIGSGISVDSGGTISAEGKPTIYLNEMSQSDAAAFYSEILPYSGSPEEIIGKYDIYYYDAREVYEYKTFYKINKIGFYRGIFRFFGESTVFGVSFVGIFDKLLRVKLESNGSITADFDTYCKVLSVTASGSAHTLSFDSKIFETYTSRIVSGNVPISLRLGEEKITTTKCNIADVEDNAYLYAEWEDNSGITYEGKWKFKNGELPVYFREKSAGEGKKTFKFNEMTQAELADMYAELTALPSATTNYNELYDFYNFADWNGGGHYRGWKMQGGYPDSKGRLAFSAVTIKENDISQIYFFQTFISSDGTLQNRFTEYHLGS